MQVFLDLDGVLAEFHDSAFTFFGKEVTRPRVYDIVSSLGMLADDFWNSLDYGFWRNLPWTQEGEKLFEGILDLVPARDVFVLSSPSWTSGCLGGKADWVKHNLGHGYLKRLHLAASKFAVAAPGKILIDDFDTNVMDFRKHKGKALLVPRQWNSRKTETVGDGGFDVDAVLEEFEKLYHN